MTITKEMLAKAKENYPHCDEVLDYLYADFHKREESIARIQESIERSKALEKARKEKEETAEANAKITANSIIESGVFDNVDFEEIGRVFYHVQDLHRKAYHPCCEPDC